MSRVFPKLVASTPGEPASANAMQMGVLVGLDAQARPLVTVGRSGVRHPVVARSTIARPADWDEASALPVLLMLEEGDPTRPIIVGLVSDAFAVTPSAPPLLDLALRPTAASLDGKRLQFEASEEVVLKCGKGSITLQANGRVVIKGTELVSRASGSNKIRGASVNIN
jgi:hypothetical protein